MWQNSIAGIIVGLAVFFIGRKIYKQFQQITDPSKEISCSCSCSGCSVKDCSSKK